MPNLSQCSRVKCPYFLRLANNGRGVICEGLIPGSEIINCFRTADALTEWVVRVCETNEYTKHCLLAQVVESKYMSD